MYCIPTCSPRFSSTSTIQKILVKHDMTSASLKLSAQKTNNACALGAILELSRSPFVQQIMASISPVKYLLCKSRHSLS